MTSRKFYVDWRDPSYPKIEDVEYSTATARTGQSLAACQAEIRGAARDRAQHWSEVVAFTDALRESDIPRVAHPDDL